MSGGRPIFLPGVPEDKVRAFIAELGDKFTYPVALDASRAVSGAYPSAGIPNAYVQVACTILMQAFLPAAHLALLLLSLLRNALLGPPARVHAFKPSSA